MVVGKQQQLNLVLMHFAKNLYAGEGVFQKDFQWFVRKFVGAINGQSKFVTEEFNNGYIFAWDDYTERLTLSPYSFLRYESTFQTKIFQRTSLFSHEISPCCYHRCSALE